MYFVLWPRVMSWPSIFSIGWKKWRKIQFKNFLRPRNIVKESNSEPEKRFRQ